MKIALIGATGYVGSVILKEALSRGHEVTAIARHPENLSRHESLIVKKGDLFNIDELCQSIKGLDAVISAFNAFSSDLSASDSYNDQIEGIKLIIKAAKKSGVSRLLVVGGAGSLENKEGVQLVDTAEFPQEWKDMALSMRESLDILKNEKELKWTFLSPSALLKPGERTGKFKLGENQLIVDIKGESKISVEDYAMAMVDELENPKHTNKRFTVGYS